MPLGSSPHRAGQIAGLACREAEVPRIDFAAANRTARDGRMPERDRWGWLHPNPPHHAHQARSMSIPPACPPSAPRRRVIGAGSSERRRGGIGQRPPQIEYRANAERGAIGARAFIAVKIRREQKRETGGRKTPCARLSSKGIVSPALDQIRAAAAAGNGAIAMLDTGSRKRPPAAPPRRQLRLPEASPPVPTMSMASSASGNAGFRASERMAPAKRVLQPRDPFRPQGSRSAPAIGARLQASSITSGAPRLRPRQGRGPAPGCRAVWCGLVAIVKSSENYP